jgi:hypothetical protein
MIRKVLLHLFFLTITPVISAEVLQKVDGEVLPLLKETGEGATPALVLTSPCLLVPDDSLKEQDIAGSILPPAPSQAASQQSTLPVDDDAEWLLLEPQDRRELPLVDLEADTDILQIIKSTSSIENVPINIFYLEPSTLKYALVQSGFQLKYAASWVISAASYIPFFGSRSIFSLASTPALNRLKDVNQGDIDNFAEFTLQDVYAMLKDIPDRESFVKLPLHKRSKPFVTKGVRVIGKGYNGMAIIEDLNYGTRLVRPGQEIIEIIKDHESPLDGLVSQRTNKNPREWLEKFFNLESDNSFRILNSTCNKDIYGNTWVLYELAAGKEGMFLKVMRKPIVEYENRLESWKIAWLRHHPSHTDGVIEQAGAHKDGAVASK